MTDNLKKLSNDSLSTRAKVVTIIEEILNGKSLSLLLDTLLASVSFSDKPFAHELLMGTLRQWWALTRIAESLAKKSIDDHAVLAVLNIGLYQLLYMNTADYAAIHNTVEALKQLNKSYAVGFVNAILRKVQQSLAKYQKKVQKNHSLPNWLAKQLKQDWPLVYDELSLALRHSAAIFLRVNEQKVSIDKYSEILNNNGVSHNIISLGYEHHQTIRLDSPVQIATLPYFEQGWVSVQDMHAQLSAFLLKPLLSTQGKRVLDMCCAPGGKTAHLLEKFHMKHIVAIDCDESRLNRVHENLNRLNLNQQNITIMAADGTSWQDKSLFDVILLDAPCTATGVIRRHPDIALLRQEADILATCELQAKILQNAWRQLKTGGVLLYVTCSILKAENELQIIDFIKKNTDAQATPFVLDLPNQIKQTVGYQCLPLDRFGGDGFYYAMLTKCAT
ncbi:16S rRNA (cytosine967-C5)-methyltransferase [Moraxella cuniculi DSM 21768]|uniref:16S rRNA (cytosine(967)-C(5))-methyltransferase n=1 Tax=Moraxella cuniculi DSM 21768 TaxID=1122245 RepID=A0A1N7DVC4_9GAMM|nr:16S rRNA (cytosine(967)-C(5))-methyltransferase RsmB [Moraxella cuniculi]OOS07407.1 16S rRNA (cytosine(967)-C(5))-methyltransferase [Moraxella cuniculi]SIR79802.1 16S rRNA (cytosine967-C5)-methyltransferase [Moraxella cuniculi DSM 21768]